MDKPIDQLSWFFQEPDSLLDVKLAAGAAWWEKGDDSLKAGLEELFPSTEEGAWVLTG